MPTWQVRLASKDVTQSQLALEPQCEFSSQKDVRCKQKASQVLMVGIKEMSIISVIFSLCETHAGAQQAIEAYKDNLRRYMEGKNPVGLPVTLEFLDQSAVGPEIGG